MNKYFPHDCNARSDERIIALRIQHGWTGYGLYFALIEKLCDCMCYSLKVDYNLLAYDLRSDASLVKSVINDFGLFAFTEDGECFYSESLNRRMEPLEAKSKRAQDAAKKRWESKNLSNESSEESVEGQDTNAMQMHRKSNAKDTVLHVNINADKIREDKIRQDNNIPPIPPRGGFSNEKKIQEKEEALKAFEEELNKRARELNASMPFEPEPESKIEIEFERFRKEYPGNKRGFKVEFDNFKKKHKDYQSVVFLLYPALLKLKEWRDLKKGMGQFAPEYANMQTWINQRRWEVELEKIETHGNIKHTDGAKAREQQTDRAIMEYAAKAFGKDVFGDS